MKPRKTLYIALVIGILCLTSALALGQKNPHRLKPGAKGKLCLNCHLDFEEKLEKRFVHTPVEGGECAGCHNPHASSHGALLAEDPNDICLTCHEGLLPEAARSTHQVVLEGQCDSCHDPHAADNRSNLLAGGNELCFGCHGEMEKFLSGAEIQHAPVTDGCLSCHNPHASTEGDFLLAEEEPSLCLTCHDPGRKIFKQRHVDYPVEKAKCTSCHNPHGGDEAGIFYGKLHSPVGNRMCNQCHESPNSADPFATKRAGFELCRMCHNDTVSDAFTKDSMHWPVVDQKGCANCHTPHASPEDALLKASPLVVCKSCHMDTIERQENSETKHEPIMEGECSACHYPHAANTEFFLRSDSQLDLCGKCHDWQAHSAHPLGAETVDPRNENVSVQCTSCHRSHGTPYKKMFYYPEVQELCVQCHKQYRR